MDARIKAIEDLERSIIYLENDKKLNKLAIRILQNKKANYLFDTDEEFLNEPIK